MEKRMEMKWTLGCNLRYDTPIMENQMEKKMENEMDTGITMGHFWLILGGRLG